MSVDASSSPDSLEAKSPFELRLNQGSGSPESFIKKSLETGDVGFLHSFTTGSAVDGPGVRVVAWTAGCQWRCRYCHNPDTWSMINGMPVPLERAVDEIRKYRRGLQVMSGGFTLSGGEPLMQDRFAVRLLTATKAMGIHTAIETNGYLGDRLSDAELEQIDLVLLGIKTWGTERHQDLTGKDIGPTLDFAAPPCGQEATDLGALCFSTGFNRRSGGYRLNSDFRGKSRKRGSSRGAAFPSDGSFQVGKARARLLAQGGRAAVRRTDRTRTRPIPQLRAVCLLIALQCWRTKKGCWNMGSSQNAARAAADDGSLSDDCTWLFGW